MKKLILCVLAISAFAMSNAQDDLKSTVQDVKDILLSRPTTNLKG